MFIAADTAEKKVNLYLSDTKGQFYIESLSDLVVLRLYSGGFDADLYEVDFNIHARRTYSFQWN